MKRVLSAFLIFSMLLFSPVYGASTNSVSSRPSVKENYEFKPGNAYVYFYVRESGAGTFGTGDVKFLATLNGAEWFKDTDANKPSAMAAASVVIPGATVTITRLSDKDIEVALNRSGASMTEEAWWRIPVYAVAKEAGVISLTVDGRDGMVTSGQYPLADSPGGNFIAGGTRFDTGRQQWMTIKEEAPGSYRNMQTVRLQLTNGTWFPENDSDLGIKKMLENTVISGVEAGRITGRRVDDSTVELQLDRGAASSGKVIAVWSVPLYFSVKEFGEAKVSLQSVSGDIRAGALGDSSVISPIRYVKTVTLTLGRTDIHVAQQQSSSVVKLDVSPVNPEGATMIPVRGVFEQLGGTVDWNAADRTVKIVVDGKALQVSADGTKAEIDGRAVTLSVKPEIINGRLLIPLRTVSEQLGFSVEWVEDTKQIIIRQD